MHHSFTSTLALSSLFVAACTHQPEPAPVSTTSAALDAQTTLAKGGEFRFVLAESPGVLADVTARCATNAQPEACMTRIADAGAKEGWRVIPGDAEHVRVQSFGREEGREEIYLEAPCTLAAESATEVVLRPTAPLTGTRLPPAEQPKELRVSLPNADTLLMHDRKGTMTFRRVAATR